MEEDVLNSLWQKANHEPEKLGVLPERVKWQMLYTFIGLTFSPFRIDLQRVRQQNQQLLCQASRGALRPEALNKNEHAAVSRLWREKAPIRVLGGNDAAQLSRRPLGKLITLGTRDAYTGHFVTMPAEYNWQQRTLFHLDSVGAAKFTILLASSTWLW